jgi:hypothetical protein
MHPAVKVVPTVTEQNKWRPTRGSKKDWSLTKKDRLTETSKQKIKDLRRGEKVARYQDIGNDDERTNADFQNFCTTTRRQESGT